MSKATILSILIYFMAFTISFGDDEKDSLNNEFECAEAVAPEGNEFRSFEDSTKTKEKRTISEPSYDPAGPALTIGIGILALLSGSFGTTAILVLGGIFFVLGILLLVFYNKLKKINPFKIRGPNVIAKLLFALFFLLFLLALLGSVILALTVASALLLAAILSAFINPVVVALAIIGGGVAWLLGKIIRYYIKKGKYKRSLR